MPARKKYDAVATIGEYKDRATGQTKKRYATVGTVFESDDGRLSLKLDTIPVGPGWSGFISFYEPRQAEGSPRPSQASPAQQRADAYQRAAHSRPAAPPAPAYDDDGDDEIPF